MFNTPLLFVISSAVTAGMLSVKLEFVFGAAKVTVPVPNALPDKETLDIMLLL
jgi:hypothetical protein